MGEFICSSASGRKWAGPAVQPYRGWGGLRQGCGCHGAGRAGWNPVWGSGGVEGTGVRGCSLRSNPGYGGCDPSGIGGGGKLGD